LGIDLKHHDIFVEVNHVVEGGQAQMGGVPKGDVLTHIQRGSAGGRNRFALVPRVHSTGMVVPCSEIGDAIKAQLERWGQTRLRFLHRSPPQ
jgi:hypothetical protein